MLRNNELVASGV